MGWVWLLLWLLPAGVCCWWAGVPTIRLIAECYKYKDWEDMSIISVACILLFFCPIINLAGAWACLASWYESRHER